MKIFDSLSARLVGMLRRKGVSRPDAEDLVQEAWLKVWKRCQSKAVLNREAYLTQAVKNLHIDFVRKRQRQFGAGETVDASEKSSPLETPLGPDEVLHQDQRLKSVETILNNKSPRTCEIFLAHRAGYSQQFLATYHKISVSAVQKHIAAAMETLMDAKEILLGKEPK